MQIRKAASQFRLVYKRSSRATKIAVCAAIVTCVIALLAIHIATTNARAQAEEWRAKAQQLEQEKRELQDKIDKLGTVEGVEDAARDEGYEYPDTTIIVPGN